MTYCTKSMNLSNSSRRWTSMSKYSLMKPK